MMESWVFHIKNVPDLLKQNLHDELYIILSKYEVCVPDNVFQSSKYLRLKLYELIESGVEVSDELVCALFPVGGAKPRLDSLGAYYLTKVIDRELQSKNYFNTRKLKEFGSILCDDVSIDCLREYATRKISRKYGEDKKVVIAKHRVHYDTLVSKRNSHLDYLDKLMSALNDVNAIPMVAYGTLLGAFRDEAFLPFDDDIDIILYYPDIVEKCACERERNSLIEYLRRLGFTVGSRSSFPHITVNSSTASVGIDIFLHGHLLLVVRQVLSWKI